MPPQGRPLGAKGSKQRRQWEREQALMAEQIRIEEIDSDDSEGIDTSFVQKRRFVSDPLQFTGVDLGANMRPRRSYTVDNSDEDSDSVDGNESATQIAMREKEERLVQSALARIRRAQEKGKKDVKLHEDELKALERRRLRLQAEEAKKKKKKNSGSSSSDKDRRRSDRMVTVPIASSEQPRRRSGRVDEGSPLTRPLPAIEGPGIRYEAPDGSTSYASIGAYPSSARSSPSRPRSSSSAQRSSRRETLPPMPQYQAYNPGRHVSEGSMIRPTSSSSLRRPLPDDEDWAPSSRRSSVSSNLANMTDPFEYQTGSDTRPARRGVSGPADVIYSTIPRRPPGQYPGRGAYVNSASDPTLGRQRPAEAQDSDDEDTSSLSDSDDLGHGVLVEPERERERRSPAPTAAPVSRKPVGGKKKGKR